MKVTLHKMGKGDTYVVMATQGNQQFQVGYTEPASKEECEHMAKMFRYALRAHDKERDARRKQGSN